MAIKQSTQTSCIRMISQIADAPSFICPSPTPPANECVGGEGLLDSLGSRNCGCLALRQLPLRHLEELHPLTRTCPSPFLSHPYCSFCLLPSQGGGQKRGMVTEGQSPACSLGFCRCHLKVPARCLHTLS